MISRRRKITTAGLVLAIGFAIAWPFRRSGEVQSKTKVAAGSPAKGSVLLPGGPAETSPPRMDRLSGPVALNSSQENKPESFHATTPSHEPSLGLPSTLASTLVPSEPSLFAQVGPTPMVASPVAEFTMPEAQRAPSLPRSEERRDPQGKRPIYSTAMLPANARQSTTLQSNETAKLVSDDTTEPTTSDLRIHVVHNGDTLERLAARYLDDERRAMEIFDLNRGTLTNPHLLPIGVEIVIPAKRLGK